MSKKATKALNNKYYVRKTAIRAKVPYMTTMAAARATAEGIEAVLKYGEIGVMSLQEIHKAIQ